MAKGNACKSADATASNHRRGEIERIVAKFSSMALQKYLVASSSLGKLCIQYLFAHVAQVRICSLEVNLFYCR